MVIRRNYYNSKHIGAGLATIVANTIEKFNWDSYPYGISEITLGPCVSIKDGILYSGYSLLIQGDALVFPPPGIPPHLLGRRTSLYTFENTSDHVAVGEFPERFNAMDNLKQNERDIDAILMGDPDGSVSLGTVEMKDHHGIITETKACLVIDSSTGIKGTISREQTFGGTRNYEQGVISGKGTMKAWKKEASRVSQMYESLAWDIASSVWGKDPSGSCVVKPTLSIVNSTGDVYDAGTSDLGTGAVILAIGMTDGSECHDGVLVRNELPGAGWVGYLGHNELNTHHSWGNPVFRSLVPRSFGFDESKVGFSKDYDSKSEVLRRGVNNNILSLVHILESESTHKFNHRKYTLPDTIPIINSIYELGFPYNANTLVMSPLAQVLGNDDPDKLDDISRLENSFPDKVNLSLTGKWLTSLLRLVASGTYPDEETHEKAQALFPSLNPNGKMTVPTSLLIAADLLDKSNPSENNWQERTREWSNGDFASIPPLPQKIHPIPILPSSSPAPIRKL